MIDVPVETGLYKAVHSFRYAGGLQLEAIGLIWLRLIKIDSDGPRTGTRAAPFSRN